MRYRFCCAISLVVTLAGCSSSSGGAGNEAAPLSATSSQGGSSGAGGTADAAGAAGASDVAGAAGASGDGSAGSATAPTCGPGGTEYRHTIDKSRGPIPPDSPMTKAGNLDKWIGGQGVFAVDVINGAATLLLNGGAPEYKVPQSLDADAHNQAVHDYFVGAGLPECEIGGIGVLAGGDGYTSSISRSLGGIPVAESMAWANLRDDGHSEAESVFWPPLPASVVSDAQSLAAAVADHSFFAKLPPGTPDNGQVLIHHAPFTDDSGLDPYASYDVIEGEEVIQFTADGMPRQPG